VPRVDQKLTRNDGPAAAFSGQHDCNLSRIAIEEARHDAVVAVVAGDSLVRSINEPITTIRSLRFRTAAFNSHNHGLNSLGTDTLSRQSSR
jgi:hypothetical protein